VNRLIARFIAIATLMLFGLSAHAADIGEGWTQWWLPPDRSTHGRGIDVLFYWTFWITMIVFVVVEIVLVVFLIKYRHKADRPKGIFTHGNTRLEMCWTLAPAVIFIALAVANKGVWERLRFNPDGNRPDKATILVIGQQFKWNVVYPGPDGKLGRYLMFPKPTDLRWPGGKKFAQVDGPGFLPYDKAIGAINSYIEQQNPLGKDFDDPDGKDDNWEKAPGRAIHIPVDRPVEVQLGSKDVIHSFFLPNFRVKLDAVPGLRGKIVFTSKMTSASREVPKSYSIAELETAAADPANRELTLKIDATTPQAQPYKSGEMIRYYRYVDKDGKTIVRDGMTLGDPNRPADRVEMVKRLKDAGITQVSAYQPGYWDLVCEELCGQGHFTMQGQLIVLSQDEYAEKFEGKKKSLNPPTTKPSNVAVAN
jgi:heme/copper-type cytochrome/quinol oxidase subunit 2